MSARSSKSRILSGLLAISAAGALSVPAVGALARDGIASVSGKRLVMTRAGVEEAGSDEAAATDTRSGDPSAAAASSDDGSVGGCTGVVVKPGASIQAAIDRSPPGSTLCLGAGHYATKVTIKPKNGMSLVGAGKQATFIRTTSAPTVIEARGRNGVLLKGFDVSGAVGSRACKPGCGRGIRPGIGTVIEDVRSHHNAIAGIGGAGPDLLVRDSELDHNGGPSFVGCCAGGIKASKGFRIENSYVHDNAGIGIWCDVGCRYGSFEVRGNTVVGNTVGGIRYEISASRAVISGNTVRGNNTIDKGGHGGIEINSSRNAVVEHNVVSGNSRAGIVANGRRDPGLANVAIRSNTLNGDKLTGCGAKVTCTNNR